MKKAHKKRPPRATTFCMPVLLDMGGVLYKSGKLKILKRNIKSTIISIPVYQSSEIRIFDKNMPLSCTS